MLEGVHMSFPWERKQHKGTHWELLVKLLNVLLEDILILQCKYNNMAG